jgi:demethylmenaquinone methyltransferase / 2-methoxy-6-polyprenyl-1,4-benzoquinol methylase
LRAAGGEALGRDKRPDRIEGMFDAIAPNYDLLNHVLSAGMDIRWRAQAVRSLELRGGETVLDLCTGTADAAIAAASASRRATEVVGIDRSGEMLKIGRAKLARRGLSGRVRLVQGDVTRLPLGAGSVDAAIVAFGIRNVERPEHAYAEVHRVLRPGGRFSILEFGIPPARAVRWAYLAYFRHVLPRIGSLVSRHASAYRYLPASVDTFPEPARVVALLGAAGFSHLRADPLTLGVVYLYSAAKPVRP